MMENVLAGHRGSIAAREKVPQWIAAAIAGSVIAGLTLGSIQLPSRLAPLVAPVLLLLLIAAAARSLRRVLIAVVLLDIPLQFDANLDYHPSLAALGGLPGFNVSVTTGALIALYALWAAELLRNGRGGASLVRLRFPLALAAYLAAVAASVFVASDTTAAAYEVVLLIQMFLLYVYLANTVTSRSDVLFIVGVLLAGLAFESLFILAQQYVGADFHLPGITNRIDPGVLASGLPTRLGGTIGSPNSAGAYLALFLAPALAVSLLPIARRYRVLALAVFFLGLVALVHTLSRGGWLAATVSLLVTIIVACRRGWLSPVLPLVAVGLVAAALFFTALPFQGAVAGRLHGNDYGAAHSRVALARFASRVIEDHPIVGVGANNYAVVLPRYETPEFAADWHYTVHNKYLLVSAETGLVGLVAFLAFLGSTLRSGWRGVRVDDRVLAPLALAFTAAVLGQMAHMFFDIFHSRSQVQSLWVVAALLAALPHIPREGAHRVGV